VDGKIINVVSPGYLKEYKIPLPSALPTDDAETVVFLLVENVLVGSISLADTIRPEAYEAIQMLHKLNIKSVLLTGDNRKVAEAVSKKLGIDCFFVKCFLTKNLRK
jgi:Cu2+-exporting ATPase